MMQRVSWFIVPSESRNIHGSIAGTAVQTKSRSHTLGRFKELHVT